MATRQSAAPCRTSTTIGTPAAVRAVPHWVADAPLTGCWVPPSVPGPGAAVPQPAAAQAVSTASANTATAREDIGLPPSRAHHHALCPQALAARPAVPPSPDVTGAPSDQAGAEPLLHNYRFDCIIYQPGLTD